MTRAERARDRAALEQARKRGETVYVSPYTGTATPLNDNPETVTQAVQITAQNNAASKAEFERKTAQAIAKGDERSARSQQIIDEIEREKQQRAEASRPQPPSSSLSARQTNSAGQVQRTSLQGTYQENVRSRVIKPGEATVVKKADDRYYGPQNPNAAKYGGVRPSNLPGSVVSQERATARQTGSEKFVQKAEPALGKQETAFQREEVRREQARQLGVKDASPGFYSKYQIGAKREQRFSVRARQGVVASSVPGSIKESEYSIERNEPRRIARAERISNLSKVPPPPAASSDRGNLFDIETDYGTGKTKLTGLLGEELNTLGRGLKAMTSGPGTGISEAFTPEGRQAILAKAKNEDVQEVFKVGVLAVPGYGTITKLAFGISLKPFKESTGKFFENIYQNVGVKHSLQSSSLRGLFLKDSGKEFNTVTTYQGNGGSDEGMFNNKQSNSTYAYSQQTKGGMINLRNESHIDKVYSPAYIKVAKDIGYTGLGLTGLIVGGVGKSAIENPFAFAAFGKVAEVANIALFRGALKGTSVFFPRVAEKPAFQLGLAKGAGFAVDTSFVTYAGATAPEGKKTLAVIESGATLGLFKLGAKGTKTVKTKLEVEGYKNVDFAEAESLPKAQRDAFTDYLKQTTVAGKAKPQQDALDLTPTFTQVADIPMQRKAAEVTKSFLIENKRSVTLGGSAGQNPQALPAYKKAVPGDVDAFARSAKKAGAALAAKYTAEGVEFTHKYNAPVNPVKGLATTDFFDTGSFLQKADVALQKRTSKFNVGGVKVEIHDVRWKEAFAFSEKPVTTTEGISVLSLREQSRRKVVGAYLAGRANKDIPDLKRVSRSEFRSMVEQQSTKAGQVKAVNLFADFATTEKKHYGTDVKLAREAFASHPDGEFSDILAKIKPEPLVSQLDLMGTSRGKTTIPSPAIVPSIVGNTGMLVFASKKAQFGFGDFKTPTSSPGMGLPAPRAAAPLISVEGVKGGKTITLSAFEDTYQTRRRPITNTPRLPGFRIETKGYDYKPKASAGYGGYAFKLPKYNASPAYKMQSYVPKASYMPYKAMPGPKIEIPYATIYKSGGYTPRGNRPYVTRPGYSYKPGSYSPYSPSAYLKQGSYGYQHTVKTPPPPPPERRKLFDFNFDLAGRPSSKSSRFTLKQPKRYAPTLYASFGEIKAPAKGAKTTGLSGLEVRPILTRGKRR